MLTLHLGRAILCEDVILLFTPIHFTHSIAKIQEKSTDFPIGILMWKI